MHKKKYKSLHNLLQVANFQKVPFVYNYVKESGRKFYMAESVKHFNKGVNKKDFLKIINLYSEAISFIGPGNAAGDQTGSFGLRYVF